MTHKHHGRDFGELYSTLTTPVLLKEKAEAADAAVVHRRASAMGLSMTEYRSYRARLRADYKKRFVSHKGMTTSLPFGILFPILDPDAQLAVTMCSRMPTDEERKSYGEAFWRRRKPGEGKQEEAHIEPAASALEPV